MIGGYDSYDGLGKNNYFEKTYTGLASHTSITLKFRAYTIDSWDTEKYYVSVDNEEVWSKKY